MGRADAGVAPIGVGVETVVLTLAPSEGAAGAPGEPVALIVRRNDDVFGGAWGLPGSRLAADEDLEAAALRVLAATVGEVRHLEQLATFGSPERHGDARVVSVTYLGLLPVPADLGGLGRDGARWVPVDDPPRLAFDHAEILATAIDRLRAKLTYSTVAYGLLPDRFTLSELQAVYESVLGHALDKRNFRKRVQGLGLVEEAEGQRRGPHRPAQLYRFPRSGLVLLDDVITT